MKEFSIEEKAKRYDEAIKRAKEAAEKGMVSHNFVSDIFPELKESEDERIRKELLNAFQESEDSLYMVLTPHRRELFIAWLEKQDEKPTLPKWKYKKDNTPLLRDSLILNKYGCVAKSPSGAIVSDVWVIDYDELAKLPKEEFEKQGEKKSIESTKTKLNASMIKPDPNPYWTLAPEYKLMNEQKPAYKAKPKFKVGDWIINSQGTLRHIINVDKGGYQTDGGWLSHYTYEKTFHLWTINDAKGGDVLACPNDAGDRDVVFIFKNINSDEGWVFCFCASDANGCFCTNNDYVGNSNSTNISPATKEQRDLLFQKMEEAGYEWDAEKKELKKISQEYPLTPDKCIKPAWSKEDEERYISCLQRLGTGDPEQPETINSKWFKDHVYPRTTWKPSEQDILLLERIANGKSNPQDFQASLCCLIGQLKELRKEKL